MSIRLLILEIAGVRSIMINIAIIGLGYWGPNLLRVFDSLPDCMVKYCYDLDSKNNALYQKLYPHVSFLSQFEKALDDSCVDAIVIATPASTHYSLAKQALMNNKHVFVEKPITLILV